MNRKSSYAAKQRTLDRKYYRTRKQSMRRIAGGLL